MCLVKCWPKGKVAYPDFFRKSTQKWWIDSIERHHKDLPFDGLWIDMNEPAVFGTNEERLDLIVINVIKCELIEREVLK